MVSATVTPLAASGPRLVTERVKLTSSPSSGEIRSTKEARRRPAPRMCRDAAAALLSLTRSDWSTLRTPAKPVRSVPPVPGFASVVRISSALPDGGNAASDQTPLKGS